MIDTYTPENSPVMKIQGRHRSLHLSADFFSDLGGFDKHWLYQPLSPLVSEQEVKFVLGWRKYLRGEHPVHGLCYSGAWLKMGGLSVQDRFQAMAAAWVRTFVDARIRSVRDLVNEENTARTATVLMIPDFCTDRQGTEYLRTCVASLLMDRIRSETITVVYSTNTKRLQELYGREIHDLLTNQYVEIKP